MKKRIICLMIAALLVFSFAACGKSAQPAETTAPAEQTSSAPEAVPAADMEKASAAYAAFLAKYDAMEAGYIADLNDDGYPELIGGKAEGLMQQFSLTYTDKTGLCVQYPNAYSGLGVRFFASDDNCFYYRDDGHTQGTANYHSAYIYSADDIGFVLKGCVYGDPWPDIPEYSDEILEEMDEKYDKLFDEKLMPYTQDITFTDFWETEMPQDMDAYLNEGMQIDLAAARKAYADARQTLTQAVTDAAGKAPASVSVSDFDRNGSFEAFALVEESKVGDDVPVGVLWFAPAEGEAKQIADGIVAVDEMDVLSCAYHDYFHAPLYGGSSSPTSVWEVTGSDCRQVAMFDVEESALEWVKRTDSVYLDPETLISTLSAFDAMYTDDLTDEETGEPMGVGHTHKPYFFRDTPDGIKEYGGIEVQAAEIEKIPGGKELLALAQQDGRKLESIYYRENGIVDFSMSERSDEGSEYTCFNALFADGRLMLLDAYDFFPREADDDEDTYLLPGFYTASASGNATYPDKMA